jgi:hypothetical protein
MTVAVRPTAVTHPALERTFACRDKVASSGHQDWQNDSKNRHISPDSLLESNFRCVLSSYRFSTDPRA